MNSSIAQALVRELQGQRMGYVVADANLSIVATFGDPTRFRECDPAFIGVDLPDAVPELVGSEDILRAIVAGTAERLHLDVVNREDSLGQTIYVSITSFAYQVGPDEVGLIYLIEDISSLAEKQQMVLQQRNELALAQRELEQAVHDLTMANQELRRTYAAQMDIVSIVGFQMNEPLGIIRGFLEVLVADGLGSFADDQRSQLEMVTINTEQLQRVTRAITAIMRIEADQLRPQVLPADLLELIDESVEFVRPKLQENSVQVELEIERDLPQVICDWDATVSALENLLNIAIGCTPPEGVITVRLRTLVDEAQVQVELECPKLDLSEADFHKLSVLSQELNHIRIGSDPVDNLEVYVAIAVFRLQGCIVQIRSLAGSTRALIVRFPISA